MNSVVIHEALNAINYVKQCSSYWGKELELEIEEVKIIT